MYTWGHQYIFFIFCFKKHCKQKTKSKVWNLQKAFSLRTISVCRFEKIDDVKYVYCIKHVYKLLREQVGFAAVLWRLPRCVSCLLLTHGPVRKIMHVSRTTNEIHGCFLNSHILYQITFNFSWKMLSLDFKLQILKIEGLILFFQSMFQFQCTFHSRSAYLVYGI